MTDVDRRELSGRIESVWRDCAALAKREEAGCHADDAAEYLLNALDVLNGRGPDDWRDELAEA